jgi:hypothetical protein
MEELRNTRKQMVEKVSLELAKEEEAILEQYLKAELSTEEEEALKAKETRRDNLKVLHAKVVTELKELEEPAEVPNQEKGNLDGELRKLAQQENVLKGILSRKPVNLNFNSSKNDPLAFIEEFGKFINRELPTEALKNSLMMLLLNACTKDDPKSHSFSESLLVNGTPKNLEELKKKFMIFYKGNVYLGSQLPRLANVAMGKEKPSDYCSRVSMICTGSGIDLMENKKENRKYLETWFANLPPQEQNNLQSEFNKLPTDASVQDYLNLVTKMIPQEPGFLRKLEMFCPYCSSGIIWDCHSCRTGDYLQKKEGSLKRRRNPNAQNDDEPLKRPKFDLRTQIDKNKEQAPRKTENELEKLKKEGKCFKCEMPWSPKDHKCGPMVNVAVMDDLESEEGWNDELENAVNENAFVGMGQVETMTIDFDRHRPKVDLFLNGNKAEKLNLDTGSDLTLITKTALNRIFGNTTWKKLIKKNERKIRTASMEFVKPMGSIEMLVQRKIGGKEIKHEFVIVGALPMGVKALVGLDLQRKLGFRLIEDGSPLVMAVGTEGHEPTVIGESGISIGKALRGLRDCNKTDSNYLMYLESYRRHVWANIDQLKRINEGLKGFCTFPGAEIRFETIDEDPVVVNQYPIAMIHHTTIEKQILEWEDLGVLEDETSLDHNNNPLLVVPKRDITGKIKDWRVCVDPRMVNLKIKDSTHRLPKIETIFQRLAGKRVFSIIDLKSGFNQIKVAKEHRKKTAFTWKQRVRHFIGAPFGFKNIPQDFQRIMDRIFSDFDFVIPYIDDLIISSNSYEEHMRHVRMVVERLNQYNLRVNWKKCQLAYESIVILGHRISQEGIQVVKEKLSKMEQWKKPTTIRMLQRQLGFLNYFRGFIPNYSKLMAPIELLRTGKKKQSNEKIIWEEKHQLIMDQVYKILNSELLLVYPNFEEQFYVATDASQYGLGAVLYQMDNSGKKHYVKFASRSLSKSERNYGAPQRELLGVLFALEKFHDIVYGRPFTLYTDHQSLTYLLTKANLAPSLRNWLGEILEYDFDIVHLPGLENHLPDALSRLYEAEQSEWDRPVGLVLAHFAENEIIVDETELDIGIRPGIYSIDLDNLDVVEDLELRNDIMTRAHIGFHEGAAGMARLIRSSLESTWPNLERDCQEFVKKCIKCQKYNIGRHGYQPPKSIVAMYPFDHICVDLKEMPLSDQGNHYYLLVIDVATRFIFLRPLIDKTAYSVAQTLYQIFTDVGFPKMIQSDNGTEFINEVMASVKALANIMERLIAPYSHKSNGIAERSIGVTSNAIWKSLEGRVTNWDKLLPAIQFNYNNRVLEIHGSTPYSLVFARRANDFFDYSQLELTEEEQKDREQRLLFLNSIVFPEIKEKVKRTLTKRNEYFKRTHRISKSDYINGAYVMMKVNEKGPKYKAKYEGPLKVIGREASGAYRLQGLDGTEYVRSPDLMKLVQPDIVKGLEVDTTVYAAVSKIVNHKDLIDGTRLYQVRWHKHTANHDSWLKESDFQDLGPVQDYEKGLSIRKKNDTPMKPLVRNALDSNGQLKESITLENMLPLYKENKPQELDQKVLLSDSQRQAWGPKQFMQHAKRVHSKSIIEEDSDSDSD